MIYWEKVAHAESSESCDLWIMQTSFTQANNWRLKLSLLERADEPYEKWKLSQTWKPLCSLFSPSLSFFFVMFSPNLLAHIVLVIRLIISNGFWHVSAFATLLEHGRKLCSTSKVTLFLKKYNFSFWIVTTYTLKEADLSVPPRGFGEAH